MLLNTFKNADHFNSFGIFLEVLFLEEETRKSED